MKARVLKALNIPGMIVMALLLLTLQSTLFNHPTIKFFQPDAVLFLVLWLGIKRTFVEGGIMTLILGYCVEILSGAPAGLFLTSYMFIYLCTRFLNQTFQILNRRTIMLLGIGASLVERITVLFILFVINKADNQWFHTIQLLAPTAIIHAILAVPMFRMFYRFDDWTLKNPESEHRFENEYHLDEEWV
jgi:cell shape-determining protein MreD